MRQLLFTLLQVLYLFAPLLVASLLSGITIKFNLASWLKRPIDAGKTFQGKRLFGDNKTWRGVAVAVVGCTLTAALQKYLLADLAQPISLFDYHSMSVLAFGAAMGGGATLGELPNSFVKRQLGIAPGKTTKGPLSALFYVWDQVDLLTCWPLIALWVRPTFSLVALSFLLALLLHPTVSLIGYLIGARKSAR